VRRLQLAALVAVAGTLAVVAAAVAGGGHNVRERLKGFEEVPAVSTVATGEFRAAVRDGQIAYKLSWSGLEGDVTQAHIHLGQERVSGGISVWLCDTAAARPPVGTPDPPDCPTAPDARSGSVSGSIEAEDVIGPSGQGITAGEFAELLRAVRAGVTYANVHSARFPGGEIRAQIEGGHDEDDD
jgi:hypothetical protein